jgi:DNA-3-methyladenine glycosylase II
LQLSDEELKACYFSRQKISVRKMSRHSYCKAVNCPSKNYSPYPTTRSAKRLTKIKGIGNWTVDVFLMMVLHRTDLFPTGDIALMNSVRFVKSLEAHSTREEILALAEAWRPNRTVAAFLFWHAYIKTEKH